MKLANASSRLNTVPFEFSCVLYFTMDACEEKALKRFRGSPAKVETAMTAKYVEYLDEGNGKIQDAISFENLTIKEGRLLQEANRLIKSKTYILLTAVLAAAAEGLDFHLGVVRSLPAVDVVCV